MRGLERSLRLAVTAIARAGEFALDIDSELTAAAELGRQFVDDSYQEGMHEMHRQELLQSRSARGSAGSSQRLGE